MRYLLQKDFIAEIPARQKYICDTMNIWTLPKESIYNDFIVLEALTPSTDSSLDICFIVGHNYMVKRFLETVPLPEKNIVAITCDGLANFSKLKLKNKNFYISKQDHRNLSPLYCGEDFGLDFDLTESELLFFNNRKRTSVMQNVTKSFKKI